MKKELYSILISYSLIVLVGFVYLVYLALTISSSSSIGLPFAFVGVIGLGLFVASFVLGIVFFRSLKYIWPFIIPVFLITSTIPSWFIYQWYVDLPVNVPPPGALTVSMSRYNSDSKRILDDYLKYELDSNNINIYQDTIVSTQIDTIIYAPDKLKLFAIIIAAAKDKGKIKYCAEYRVGRGDESNFEIGAPKGDISSPCATSIIELNAELWQYYYKKFSINGTSSKPEIWGNAYIFNFESHRERYLDKRNNSRN